jgi:hypothetical protein
LNRPSFIVPSGWIVQRVRPLPEALLVIPSHVSDESVVEAMRVAIHVLVVRQPLNLLAVGRHAEEVGQSEVAVGQRRRPALRSSAPAVGRKDDVAVGQIRGLAIAIELVSGQLAQSRPVQADLEKMRRLAAVLPENAVLVSDQVLQDNDAGTVSPRHASPAVSLLAPGRLTHVGEGQPIGVPPEVHVLHVSGPQSAGDQRPHRIGGPEARLNEDVASRLPLFRTVVVLNEAIGMISFGPDRDLEERQLLEIHVGTGQHDVPRGAADFHPPLPPAGKVSGPETTVAMEHPLQRFQGGDHPLAPRPGHGRQRGRRQPLGATGDVLGRL